MLVACASGPSPAAERLGFTVGSPLPDWAEALAGPLPETTRRMLALDRLQRRDNPLGEVLAARLRLAAAEVLGCGPLAAAARADLVAADAPAEPDAGELAALQLARQMARDAAGVDDDCFAPVLAALGPERTMAVVHTVAYANFLARLIAGLQLTDVSALPPALPAGASPPAKPVARDGVAAVSPTASRLPASVSWSAQAFEELRAQRQQQLEARARLPRPGDERLANLAERERRQSARIAWSRTAYGYQPEMTRAWFGCLYAFYGEAGFDPVFENSMFWVVTRTNDCFY